MRFYRMMIQMPTKDTPIGTVEKKNYEYPYQCNSKIRFYCSYKSKVLGEKQFAQLEHVSTLIINCLPDHEPYLIMKAKFVDFHLLGGTPNYAKYKNKDGQREDNSCMEIENPNPVEPKLIDLVTNSEKETGSHPTDAAGDLFKKVAQIKPPTYQGEANTTLLEEWLREFNKLFKAIECPEELTVNSAVYYLRGEANLRWWQNEEAMRALPNFGWDKFQELLRNKFYPTFLQKQKANEFMELKMGNMSVTEYYLKFIKLPRFAQDIVTTEKQRARQFKRGLCIDIQL
ncbi:putative 6-oxopurine nucleoside phosphorylase [Bienertia sinuspersici]